MAAPIIELFSINFKSTFIPLASSALFTYSTINRLYFRKVVQDRPHIPNRHITAQLVTAQQFENAIIALATINAARLIMHDTTSFKQTMSLNPTVVQP